MKIIHLITTLGSGGAEKMVVDLANQQAAFGHTVTVCMLVDDLIPNKSFNRVFLNDDVEFHSLKAKSAISITLIWDCYKYLCKKNPDIVHCHLNVLLFVYLYVLLKNKAIIVNTLHSLAHRIIYRRFPIQYYINKFFYKKSLIVPVTISKECQKSYSNFYRLNNSYCILNGRSRLSLTKDYYSVKREIEIMKESDNTYVFCHIGRCDDVKNQKLLIKSFNNLVSSGVDAILLIIGAGFDSKLGNEIREIANSKVKFLGEKSNVGDYLLLSNFFCLSSLHEGLSISLLEAMSLGILPICTPVGGNVDVVIDGVVGYLSKDLSVKEYTKTLLKAIKQPIKRENIVEYYEKKFSMKKCANNYLNLYIELLNKRS